MAVTDAPTVRIGGVTLASSWDETRRIALAGLRIRWGRRSHFEPAEPASLELGILDTDGHLASHTHLTGQPITITRADGRIIFRGRVDDYTFDYVTLRDPANDEPRRVWRLMVSAVCRLAELAQAIMPGPGGEPWDEALGPGSWPLAFTGAERRDQIMDAASGLIASMQWWNPYPYLGVHAGGFRWWGSGDERSILDLIEGLYATHPLAVPAYDAHANEIILKQPAVTHGLRLEWDGDTITLDLPNGRIIPARQITVPEGYRASTGINEAIDVVRVRSPRPAANSQGGLVDLPDVVTTHMTDHFQPAATGRREYGVANDALYAGTVDTTPPGESLDLSWPFPLQYVTSEFGWRDSTGSFHEGMDFSYGGIGGAAIPAAAPGTVYLAATGHAGWGNYVILEHNIGGENSLFTLYAHMATAPLVVTGQTVAAGQNLGPVGQTGNSFGDHLHFETHVAPVGGPLAWNTASPGGFRTAIDPREFYAAYQDAVIPGDPEPVLDEGVWQTQLAAQTADFADRLSGKVVLPTLRMDWREGMPWRLADALGADFIDTIAKQIPLYFPSSVFNVVLDAAGEHQIVGGTLVYHDGWTLDATVAPALGTGEGITVNQLVTIDAPLLSDYDPDITIADLGNVTIGVTA